MNSRTMFQTSKSSQSRTATARTSACLSPLASRAMEPRLKKPIRETAPTVHRSPCQKVMMVTVTASTRALRARQWRARGAATTRWQTLPQQKTTSISLGMACLTRDALLLRRRGSQDPRPSKQFLLFSFMHVPTICTNLSPNIRQNTSKCPDGTRPLCPHTASNQSLTYSQSISMSRHLPLFMGDCRRTWWRS